MTVRRHPFLGALGGVVTGLGLALLFIALGVAPFGELTLVVAAIAGALLGVLLAAVLPPMGRERR